MGTEDLREKRLGGNTKEDQRSPFQRDRDRILYARRFRRLSGITQVARADESYTYHDRLSHSLKVAQIGRRLAQYFNKDDGPSIPDGLKMNPNVVETAALAHDIGHPPFGHAAENMLNELIEQEYDVNDGFEGNAQSFRVVTRLSINRQQEDGLNLTLASLNAILKYPWKRGADQENQWGENESKKWGVYDSDEVAFREARKLSDIEKRRSAEADIMDWADDLAYAVHDVEDFYRAGVIPLDQLLRDSLERQKFIEKWAKEHEGVSENEGRNILDYISGIADGSLKVPYSGAEVQRLELKTLTSKLIGRYLGAEAGGLELQNHNDEKHFLEIADYLQNEVNLLKYMTKYYVIQDSSLASQQYGQQKIIEDLFTSFYRAILPESNNESERFRIIPRQFQDMGRRVQERGDPETQVRFVTDLITSLTEKQATQMHKRLIGDTPGTIQDRILG